MPHKRAFITASLGDMNWDWTRVLRGLAIAAWGGFFVYLLASGKATTYIGPKTSWVVTLGAICLPLVALAYLWGARGGGRAPSVRELGANGLLVAPILLALMVPAQSLGALAVKNKRTDNAPAPIEANADGQIRLYEIAWAADSAEYAKMVGVRTGQRVAFDGFVSDRSKSGRLEISRFVVGCCAADASAFSVNVSPPAAAETFDVDTWVHVTGTLTGRPGKGLAVNANEIRAITPPANPYE